MRSPSAGIGRDENASRGMIFSIDVTQPMAIADDLNGEASDSCRSRA